MSFYVKVKNQSWSLFETYYENGQRKQRAVPRTAWPGLGVNPLASIADVRQRVSALNREKSEEKRVMVSAARNLETKKRIESIFVPSNYAEEFEAYLADNFVSLQKSNTKLLSHWGRVQKLLLDLKLLPSQFFANKQKILGYLIKNEYSADYCKKLIRILNLWCEFVSEKEGRFYKPIPKLKPLDIQRLTDAYSESDSYIGESDPLTESMLTKLRGSMEEHHWKWLHVSLYFGLRPSEIERRNNSKTKWRVEYDTTIKKNVVYFYQPKLVSLPAAKRWKAIPVILPEQIEGLKYLGEEIRMPLTKTIQSHSGLHLTRYCGRKGFVDLMLSHGQSLEDISAWMGHASVDRTWRSYRNKKRVSFTATG